MQRLLKKFILTAWPLAFVKTPDSDRQTTHAGYTFSLLEHLSVVEILLKQKQIHNSSSGETINEGFPKLLQLFSTSYLSTRISGGFSLAQYKRIFFAMKSLMSKSLKNYDFHRTYNYRKLREKETEKYANRFNVLKNRFKISTIDDFGEALELIDEIVAFYKEINAHNAVEDRNKKREKSKVF